MKRVKVLVPLLFIITLFLTGCSIYDRGGISDANGKNPSASKSSIETSQKEEKFTVPDFSLKDTEGKNIKLSDYFGKVIFINFWTTWSPYCIDEMPELIKLNTQLVKENKAVLINVNVGEDPDNVKKFLSDNKLKLSSLLDTDSKVAGIYNIFSYPTTVIVNRDGTLNKVMKQKTSSEELFKMVSAKN
ncbi:MAG: TlpA disulfide reductase family protein [Bacillota bacterium]|nr:TlpA disulfide reductase family protein [Bacillota bacterium]